MKEHFRFSIAFWHTFEHELQTASDAQKLGSIDANISELSIEKSSI